MKKILMAGVIVGGLMAVMAQESRADGKELYDGKCAMCHGKDGKGQTKMGEKLGLKDLTDAKYQATFTDAQLLKTLKEGLKDGDKVKMKAYDSLSDDELKAIIAYTRAFAGKDAAK